MRWTGTAMTRRNRSSVLTGLDVLLRDGHPLLSNARIGLVTNHTAVTHEYRHIVDALHADPRFHLQRLFAPEHGVRGASQAGDLIADEIDPVSGLRVVSLYDDHHMPTPDDLVDLDVMVIDIQDVGVRHYTYLSTMVHVMEAGTIGGIPIVVLDRPNPITGLHTEGLVLEPAYTSFVGVHPIPTRHGLTLGELALLIARDRGWPTPIIAPVEGWQRSQWWNETGLPFISPSPNLPTATSLLAYPATCILEATNVSEGRGTTRPFENFGAPWIDALQLAKDLNQQGLDGVHFRPTWFTPWFSKHAGKLCGGVQIHITDRDRFHPVAAGVHILHALIHLPSCNFAWQSGPVLGMSHARLYGSNSLHIMLTAGATAPEIIATWEPNLSTFCERVDPLHIYA